MTVCTCGRCNAIVERDAKKCPQCGRRWPALFGLRRHLDRIFTQDVSYSRILAPVLIIIYLITALVAQKTTRSLPPFASRGSFSK